jgi:glucose-6-phosphate 1-dehydrogenase
MQNHMLQVLSLLTMEPPAGPGERELRDAKVAALRAARVPTPDAAATSTRRARYGAGQIGGRALPAYVDEEGVDPERGTETFAEVALELDTPRWRGTRFVLRAGKALRAQRKEAVVYFRSSGGPPGYLRIGIDGPCDVALQLSGAVPMTLTAPPPPSDISPYGHILLNLLSGGSTLSVRGDEAEKAWQVVDPVLAAWHESRVPLEEYPAGSKGPLPIAGRAMLRGTPRRT